MTQNEYQILQIIEQSPNYSQRELDSKMGVSLGQVKASVNKGLVKARNFMNGAGKIVYFHMLTFPGMEARGGISKRLVQCKLE